MRTARNKRVLRKPAHRYRGRPAHVVLGWTPNGKPVASVPVFSPEAAEKRARHWEKKGYIVSTIVEWDFY